MKGKLNLAQARLKECKKQMKDQIEIINDYVEKFGDMNVFIVLGTSTRDDSEEPEGRIYGVFSSQEKADNFIEEKYDKMSQAAQKEIDFHTEEWGID